jgi:outer membrane biogenesis lipoprotein LolB
MIPEMRTDLTPRLRNAALVAAALLLTACTYDTVRMHAQQDCFGMPQSEATRCQARTAETRAEYETRRRQLKESLDGKAAKPAADPRYEQWLPDL